MLIKTEIMQGDYILEIFDGAANGWSGTWLGIKQGVGYHHNIKWDQIVVLHLHLMFR